MMIIVIIIIISWVSFYFLFCTAAQVQTDEDLFIINRCEPTFIIIIINILLLILIIIV